MPDHPEVPEAAVEILAERIYAEIYRRGKDLKEWKYLRDDQKEYTRKQARELLAKKLMPAILQARDAEVEKLYENYVSKEEARKGAEGWMIQAQEALAEARKLRGELMDLGIRRQDQQDRADQAEAKLREVEARGPERPGSCTCIAVPGYKGEIQWEDCPYHRAAKARPADHSIPWNCPTYHDGCNCKDIVEEFQEVKKQLDSVTESYEKRIDSHCANAQELRNRARRAEQKLAEVRELAGDLLDQGISEGCNCCRKAAERFGIILEEESSDG